jgi:peptidoglycan pentaglycine glycine transferase (the first glycine)
VRGHTRVTDSNPFDFQVVLGGADPEWDDWLIECGDPHPEQSSLWGETQNHRGWASFRIQARKHGRLVGGAQILERPVGRFFKVGYVNRGPLVSFDNESLREQLVCAIRTLAKERHLDYISVVLPYHGSKLIPHLDRHGFDVSPTWLPPTTPMRSTLVLDLAASLDAIQGQMRSSHRKKIRQALKRGLSFREGGAEDLSVFTALLGSLCRRRGVASNIPLDAFVHRLWHQFAPQGQLKLFLIEDRGVAVAAELAFTMGTWFRAWRTGWSGLHSHLRPNYLLKWEMIKWAKANRFNYYDFVGFNTANALAISAGREISKNALCGMSDFKLGFGGKILPLHSNYCYFSNPLWRSWIKCRRLLVGYRTGLREES